MMRIMFVFGSHLTSYPARLSTHQQARLAQSAERKALNLVVVGSSPTVGVFTFIVVFNRGARP